MKTALALVGNALLFWGTAVTQAQTPDAPLVVLSGADSTITKAECLRITAQADWDALWSRHAGNQAKMASGVPRQQPPTVDFARCTVIALFDGKTANSGGWEVVTTCENEKEVIVGLDALSYQTMGGEDAVTPYAFVILPTSRKAIRIQIDTRGLAERAAAKPPQWRDLHRFPALAQ